MTKARLIRLSVEDRAGTVAAVIGALAEANINLVSVLGWAPQGVLQLIVDKPNEATGVLTKLGIGLTEEEAEVVELADRPGSLHAYLADLAGQGVNLRSLSGFGGANGQTSHVVWTAER